MEGFFKSDCGTNYVGGRVTIMIGSDVNRVTRGCPFISPIKFPSWAVPTRQIDILYNRVAVDYLSLL